MNSKWQEVEIAENKKDAAKYLYVYSNVCMMFWIVLGALAWGFDMKVLKEVLSTPPGYLVISFIIGLITIWCKNNFNSALSNRDRVLDEFHRTE